MKSTVISDQLFEKTDYSNTKISDTEFSNCTFKGCNFTNSDLSGCDFIEGTFDSCNLSMAKVIAASMRDITFINSKVVGVDFSRCSDFLFSVRFTNCTLNYSAFVKKTLKKTTFEVCLIRETNFSEADLTEAVFNNCDLQNTIFNRTKLIGADFRTAVNYSINPEINALKKAKFSQFGIAGLLDHCDIIIE